jgi:cytoskeleton protein RodZ
MTVSPTLKQEASITEQAVTTDPISRVGPGSHLKTAREARRLSVEEVANRLHLTKNMIMDIEADNYNNRLAFTFIRGYLRSYARLVHVSPDVVLKAFEQLNLKERRPEVLLPKVPVTTWRVEENYVRWATYGVAALVAIVVIGFSAWWLIQPRTPEPVSQDLVKLLNNVDAADKQRSVLTSTPKSATATVGTAENSDMIPPDESTEATAVETPMGMNGGSTESASTSKAEVTSVNEGPSASSSTKTTSATSGAAINSGSAANPVSSLGRPVNRSGSLMLMPEMPEWADGEE